jgi:hypothetical protein
VAEPNFDRVCMENEPMPAEAGDSRPSYHGTKADLKPGDLLEPGSARGALRRKEPFTIRGMCAPSPPRPSSN